MVTRKKKRPKFLVHDFGAVLDRDLDSKCPKESFLTEEQLNSCLLEDLY